MPLTIRKGITRTPAMVIPIKSLHPHSPFPLEGCPIHRKEVTNKGQAPLCHDLHEVPDTL